MRQEMTEMPFFTPTAPAWHRMLVTKMSRAITDPRTNPKVLPALRKRLAEAKEVGAQRGWNR